MAKHIDSSSLTVTTERRSWRLNIEAPKNASPVLTAHRELIRSADGVIIARDQNAGTVTRALAAVASEEITLQDGTILTPAHIAEALVTLIEVWEDEDNAPAPVVAPEEGV